MLQPVMRDKKKSSQTDTSKHTDDFWRILWANHDGNHRFGGNTEGEEIGTQQDRPPIEFS
jgi:hypothetical protein